MTPRFQRTFSTLPSASLITTFLTTPSLHFNSETAFFASPLFAKLQSLFSSAYQLSPAHNPTLTTLSMPDTLNFLGLNTTFKSCLDSSRYLIGIHGTSQSSLPAIVPNLPGIKKMDTTHNPYPARTNDVLFFYGSNLRMTLHYAAINSIMTEHITGDSDPLHYPARVGVLGFARQPLITQIQNHEIRVATTQAAIKESHHTQPEEVAIGQEIQLPKRWHAETLNVPVFSIPGKLRLFPLDKGMHYFQGVPCQWQQGKGFSKLDAEDQPLRFKK